MTEARPVTGFLSVYLFEHQIEVTHCFLRLQSTHCKQATGLSPRAGEEDSDPLPGGRKIKDNIRPLESSAERLCSYMANALCPSCPVTRRCCNDTSCPPFLCTSQLEWFRRQSCFSPLVYTSNPLDKHHPRHSSAPPIRSTSPAVAFGSAPFVALVGNQGLLWSMGSAD